MNPIIFQTTIKESKILTLSTIRRAFTLVELLTVVVIISMLAGMSMLVLNSTMTTAKESKTRGTIAKLDAAILDIYESYQERFDNMQIDRTRLATAIGIAEANLTEQHVALAKLHFISDIMRMEMPYQWKEVTHNASPTAPDCVSVMDPDNMSASLNVSLTVGGLIPITSAGGVYHILETNNSSVLQYYRRQYASITSTTNTAPQSSELLFLIIANLNPEALENFHGSEIGDIDNNGLREFHDAWGNPIQFIRWAPAFTGSDLQPNVVVTPDYTYQFGDIPNWSDSVAINDTAWNVTVPPYSLITNMRQANNNYSDPFDSDSRINRTWFVYPLIVSGGADGSVNLVVATRNPSNQLVPFSLPETAEIPDIINDGTIGNIRILHPTKYPTGLPIEIDGSGTYDNIHNHRSGNSF